MLKFVGDDSGPPQILMALGYLPGTTTELIAWGSRVRARVACTRQEVRAAIARAKAIQEQSKLILADLHFTG